jgi:hypothetical protein
MEVESNNVGVDVDYDYPSCYGYRLGVSSSEDGPTPAKQRCLPESSSAPAKSIAKFFRFSSKPLVSRNWTLGDNTKICTSFDRGNVKIMFVRPQISGRLRVEIPLEDLKHLSGNLSILLNAVKAGTYLEVRSSETLSVASNGLLRIYKPGGKARESIILNASQVINLNKYVKYICQHADLLTAEQKSFSIMYNVISDYMITDQFNEMNFDEIYHSIGVWGLYRDIQALFTAALARDNIASKLNLNTIYFTCMSNITELRVRFHDNTMVQQSQSIDETDS